MSDIVFNKIPKKPSPFPLFQFDKELFINDFILGYSVHDDLTFRSVLLHLEHEGAKYPCGEIKLYHSGNVYNYERTFGSAQRLAHEIVLRFNAFREKGQLCLKF
ncbi:hypothetical protein [Sulfurospirillum barnesii]|uniref:Uncharacterized protein n=1 Tax=Sulfurospirillum barnesii (strain ATCC 700032 / DSM 10660 / SES-3) TaxID=760154 RepID=I3Y0P6_SULBS|nr:hypothetical protein [Sulfurospirillum barnesii]AFL69770.1 hypothetical protein Sulba_2503 [Sulfurospirillum barnesii SES-3]